MLVPDHVRDEVVPIIYREALGMRWESLPQVDRSRAYNVWAARPDVGGILAGHLGSPDRVRPWLKDGPLKHFTSARAGVGAYAKYVESTESLPDRITRAILDDGWVPIEGSQRSKPLRFVVAHGDDKMTIIHGPSRKFRDLVWAAVCLRVDEPVTSPVPSIVVTEPAGEPVPPSERKRQQSIADQCGLTLCWLELADT